jgi:hypothetical protein
MFEIEISVHRKTDTEFYQKIIRKKMTNNSLNKSIHNLVMIMNLQYEIFYKKNFYFVKVFISSECLFKATLKTINGKS